MTYTIRLESGDENYAELEPNYRRHYEEMRERLAAQGIEVSPYQPRLDRYFAAFRQGWLLNYVVRFDGKPVGHCNIYLTNDMHNGDLIAREDVLYVVPEHRNGVGRKLVLRVLEDLRARGVRRLLVQALTDLRATKLWRRMGFKEVATSMIYDFEVPNVRT